jgi:hypothetical protein
MRKRITGRWALPILIGCTFWQFSVAAPSEYDELVLLFEEFRTFQEANLDDGIPDYSAAAVADQWDGLNLYRDRLLSIDTAEWPVSQQVDYHLVRAEMNAVEFQHKVQRPWARDPGFYSMMAGDAGATINAPNFFEPIFTLLGFSEDGPRPSEDELRRASELSQERQVRLGNTLNAIPAMYEQAKRNLTEPAADLAEFAIRNFDEERSVYEEIANKLSGDYPKLASSATTAAAAVAEYQAWMKESQPSMAAYAGLGKDNYDWWMRNVQLSPWGWEQSNQIIQSEYNRIITFLKLEEHRNRNRPELAVTMSEKAWNDSLKEALHHVVDFMRDEEIMTVADWVNPADYYAEGSRGATGELDDSPSEEFEARNTSIDTKVRQREILPGETHEYIGHMLDYQRQSRLTTSPIRSAGRRFNMGSMRLEGWAVSLEELLMQVGVLDTRPQSGRIMEYLMNASHMSLAIPDMKMHANEINLAEARKLCADIMPRGWSQEDERMVWFEMQSNLRNPGGFHSNVVTGKAYFMKLFREAAQTSDEEFIIRDFVDQFLSAGVIPMSLIRWEMTGNSDDVMLVTEAL